MNNLVLNFQEFDRAKNVDQRLLKKKPQKNHAFEQLKKSQNTWNILSSK